MAFADLLQNSDFWGGLEKQQTEGNEITNANVVNFRSSCKSRIHAIIPTDSSVSQGDNVVDLMQYKENIKAKDRMTTQKIAQEMTQSLMDMSKNNKTDNNNVIKFNK